jgi:hypothetical protein
MKKFSFTEKNNFIVKHKSGKQFSKDLELFKKYLPVNHRLSNDLSRANIHTFERLDGQMLYFLLDVISHEEILQNREEKPEEPVAPNPNPVTPPAEDLSELKERIEILEESNENNEDEIEALKKKAFSKKKASKTNSPQ